jgi:regulator of replication initiation timing
MTRLEEMVEERRRMTEEHESGRRRLSDEEYEKASRQVRNFQRKLDQMKKRSNDVSLIELSVLSLNDRRSC